MYYMGTLLKCLIELARWHRGQWVYVPGKLLHAQLESLVRLLSTFLVLSYIVLFVQFISIGFSNLHKGVMFSAKQWAHLYDAMSPLFFFFFCRGVTNTMSRHKSNKNGGRQ